MPDPARPGPMPNGDQSPVEKAEVRAWILTQARDPRHLPTFPRAAIEVVRLCDREDVPAEEVARAVALNPGTASRLLRVANSPILGTARRVATLPHAVSVLGLRAVGNLTLACAAVDSLNPQRVPGFDLRRFWRASLASAVAARSFLVFTDPALAEEAFVGGLLQDVGLVQMAAVLGPPYLELLARARGDTQEFAALEEETFGIDHAGATAALFAHWEFPPRLVESAALHLDPNAKPPLVPALRRLAAAQHLGERVGWGLAASGNPPTAKILAAAASMLGLDREKVERVLQHVRESVAGATAALQVDAGTPEELRELEERAADWLDHLAEGGT